MHFLSKFPFIATLRTIMCPLIQPNNLKHVKVIKAQFGRMLQVLWAQSAPPERSCTRSRSVSVSPDGMMTCVVFFWKTSKGSMYCNHSPRSQHSLHHSLSLCGCLFDKFRFFFPLTNSSACHQRSESFISLIRDAFIPFEGLQTPRWIEGFLKHWWRDYKSYHHQSDEKTLICGVLDSLSVSCVSHNWELTSHWEYYWAVKCSVISVTFWWSSGCDVCAMSRLRCCLHSPLPRDAQIAAEEATVPRLFALYVCAPGSWLSAWCVLMLAHMLTCWTAFHREIKVEGHLGWGREVQQLSSCVWATVQRKLLPLIVHRGQSGWILVQPPRYLSAYCCGILHIVLCREPLCKSNPTSALPQIWLLSLSSALITGSVL